jgi:serine phosphatase RsbU (regulator of sigma subunit)
MRELSPSAVLRVLNDAMMRQRRDDQFCTVAFGHLERNGVGTRLTVASGGHPLPLVLRADGQVESAGAPGTLIGVTGDARFDDAQVELRAGDAVMLYTDGVTDAAAPTRILTPDALADVLKACAGLDAASIAERVEHAATAAIEEGGPALEPRDDVAILVLRVR